MNQLSYEQKLRIAKSIAKGQRKLLHRDPKPQNVLLSKSGACKITDFGLTRIAPAQTTTLTQQAGTTFYMAPVRFQVVFLILQESIVSAHYTEKSDVWSFGILIIELMSGEHPLNHIQFTFELHKTILNDTLVIKIPDNLHGTMVCVVTYLVEMQQILQKCKEWEPKNRPAFPEIVQIFKKLQKNLVL